MYATETCNRYVTEKILPHTNNNNKIISTTQMYLLNGCINKITLCTHHALWANLTKAIGIGLPKPKHRADLSRRKKNRASLLWCKKNRTYENTTEYYALVTTRRNRKKGFL